MSSSFSRLSCVLILSLLPLLSAARPCKTLFISYYTFTATATATADPADPADPTTTSASGLATSSSDDPALAPRFFAVYRVVRLLPYRRSAQLLGRPVNPNPIPRRIAGISPSSLQDRAKDILIVVAGLLFGLGCGAITASTMYLVWSLISGGHDAHSNDGDYSDSDIESPKKMGYVQIPTAVKEGYEEGGKVISGN